MTHKRPLRLEKYDNISKKIVGMSNAHIKNLLENASNRALTSWNSSTAIVTINNHRVFIKKIPVTDLELEPINQMSTQNVFTLPGCYQYGVGSAGFGAWRELAAHELTTKWVLSETHSAFPLLYGWRLLHEENTTLARSQEDIDNEVQYWENHPSIRQRLEQINESNDTICLFLEYIPWTLKQWIAEQIDAPTTIEKMLCSLQSSLDNMKRNNFLHMDAHFENLLTDGNAVYFSDLGLALTPEFHLSENEKIFFLQHEQYDRCCVFVNFAHSIVTSVSGQQGWDEYVNKERIPCCQSALERLLKKYQPLAKIMHTFFKKIQDNKLTAFPAESCYSMIVNQKESE